MFNLGWPEFLLVLAATLILFGPKRLPEVARSFGKSIKSFKEGLKEGFEEPPAGQK